MAPAPSTNERIPLPTRPVPPVTRTTWGPAAGAAGEDSDAGAADEAAAIGKVAWDQRPAVADPFVVAAVQSRERCDSKTQAHTRLPGRHKLARPAQPSETPGNFPRKGIARCEVRVPGRDARPANVCVAFVLAQWRHPATKENGLGPAPPLWATFTKALMTRPHLRKVSLPRLAQVAVATCLKIE